MTLLRFSGLEFNLVMVSLNCAKLPIFSSNRTKPTTDAGLDFKYSFTDGKNINIAPAGFSGLNKSFTARVSIARSILPSTANFPPFEPFNRLNIPLTVRFCKNGTATAKMVKLVIELNKTKPYDELKRNSNKLNNRNCLYVANKGYFLVKDS